jgi:DNA-binding CsgD family transcriptional regulator
MIYFYKKFEKNGGFMNIDEYIMKNKDNLTIDDLCEKFNLSVPSIYRHLRMMNAKIKPKNTQRISEIKKLRNEGKTYQEIAKAYGVSRQRIEQIVHDK